MHFADLVNRKALLREALLAARRGSVVHQATTTMLIITTLTKTLTLFNRICKCNMKYVAHIISHLSYLGIPEAINMFINTEILRNNRLCGVRRPVR